MSKLRTYNSVNSTVLKGPASTIAILSSDNMPERDSLFDPITLYQHVPEHIG